MTGFRRIPHGFYEHQMQAYFSQFGDITRLRLSRNKKTGHSKHYAFIEFASSEVARIVAATMDKYLLFGHILQVRLLAPEEVHKDLFKGANKRFKAVPHNKIAGRKLRLPMAREHWDKRIDAETKRRKDKEAKLATLGYEFEMPELKGTGAIPLRETKDKALEAAATVNEPSKGKGKALPPVSNEKGGEEVQSKDSVSAEVPTAQTTSKPTKATKKKKKQKVEVGGGSV